MRRVVCGVVDGKSVVLSDGPAPTQHQFQALPGHHSCIAWATEGSPSSTTSAESAEPGVSAVPGPGGSRMLLVHFPPESVMFGPGFDPEKADLEQHEHLPGLAERFEADNPGMHQTDSVDYDIVLDGKIWLELDDGREIELAQGDIVIQQSTRHAWRNKGDKGATMAFVLIGTEKASAKPL